VYKGIHKVFHFDAAHALAAYQPTGTVLPVGADDEYFDRSSADGMYLTTPRLAEVQLHLAVWTQARNPNIRPKPALKGWNDGPDIHCHINGIRTITVKNKEGVTIRDVVRTYFEAAVADEDRGLPVCVSFPDEGERGAKLLSAEVARLYEVFDILDKVEARPYREVFQGVMAGLDAENFEDNPKQAQFVHYSQLSMDA
jgi:hypothetical protein